MSLKYAVIGTGACGGLIGGRLFASGCNVHFLARSDYEQIHEHGIEISGHTLVKCKLNRVPVYKSIEAMPKCDVILLTTKTYDNAEILPQLKSILTANSIIIILQNGLGLEKEIARFYPEIRQMITVSRIKVSKLSSGSYKHEFGDLIYAMSYCGREDVYSCAPSSLEAMVVEGFVNAGLKLQFDKDFFQRQWTKLIVNIPYFILTIKYDVSSDQIYRHHYEELNLLRAEIRQIAGVCSIAIDDEFIEDIDQQLGKAERPTYPSMKIDYDYGRKLEVESIFLPIIGMARAEAIAIPRVMAGYELLTRPSAEASRIPTRRSKL